MIIVSKFSNLQDQILNFVNIFSFDHSLYSKLEIKSSSISNSSLSPTQTVSIKTFTSFCKKESCYNSHISSFRAELLKGIYSFNDLINVKTRIYLNYNNLKIPKEKCHSKVFRFLFTQKPSPYHYDYSNTDPKEEDLIELISTTKMKYTYSSTKKQSYINSFITSPNV